MPNFTSIGLFFFVVASAEGFVGQKRLAKCAKPNRSSLAAIRASGKDVQPGTELFPGKGPYVPAGISAEEYSKMKKDEADRLKKMNFGAWGPRFKRTDTPDGDWMVLSSLWTKGYNPQLQGVATGKSSSTYDGSESPIVRAFGFLRNKFPAFLLSFILLDTLTTAFAMYRTANLTARQAVLIMLKVPSIKALSLQLSSSILKTQIPKLAAVMLLTPAMGNLLDCVNRRRLWSNSRTIGVCAGVSFVSVALWAFVLRFVTALV